MANQRLINSHAFMLAQELLETVGSCLRDEERRDAFEEFFRLAQARLEHYEREASRMQRRLRPLDN